MRQLIDKGPTRLSYRLLGYSSVVTGTLAGGRSLGWRNPFRGGRGAPGPLDTTLAWPASRPMRLNDFTNGEPLDDAVRRQLEEQVSHYEREKLACRLRVCLILQLVRWRMERGRSAAHAF